MSVTYSQVVQENNCVCGERVYNNKCTASVAVREFE